MECPLGKTTCLRYEVKPAATSGWVGRVGGRETGPYLSRDMALQLAVADLYRQRQAGCPVRLVVHDAQGAVAVDRCLCMDANRLPCAAGA